jgi:hypothetical protein
MPRKNLKQPPKKKVVAKRLSLTTPSNKNDKQLSRAFSSMNLDPNELQEFMNPWYVWAVDIMACGAYVQTFIKFLTF